jgi:hypothetical protein
VSRRSSLEPIEGVKGLTGHRNAVPRFQHTEHHPRRLSFRRINQQLQKGLSHQLAVVSRLANVITERKVQRGLLIIQAGWKNTWSIEQIQVLAKPHPTQGAGDARPPGTGHHLFFDQSIDQGRFTNVGKTEGEGTHGPRAHPTISTALIQLIPSPDRRLLHLLHPSTGLGITPNRALTVWP